MAFIYSLIESAQDHYALLLLLVFLLTFSKSCAIVSLLVPGTSGLLLLGTFASASLGHFLLMWLSAGLGQSADSGSPGGWDGAINTIFTACAGLAPSASPAAGCFYAATGPGRYFSAAFSLRCAPPFRSPAGPAAPLSGAFSSPTSAPVCCGRCSCWRQAPLASACGKNALCFKAIPPRRDIL
nr:DedA-family integral membrane protein [Raoultella sp. NCTC 9187]